MWKKVGLYVGFCCVNKLLAIPPCRKGTIFCPADFKHDKKPGAEGPGLP